MFEGEIFSMTRGTRYLGNALLRRFFQTGVLETTILSGKVLEHVHIPKLSRKLPAATYSGERSVRGAR